MWVSEIEQQKLINILCTIQYDPLVLHKVTGERNNALTGDMRQVNKNAGRDQYLPMIAEGRR